LLIFETIIRGKMSKFPLVSFIALIRCYFYLYLRLSFFLFCYLYMKPERVLSSYKKNKYHLCLYKTLLIKTQRKKSNFYKFVNNTEFFSLSKLSLFFQDKSFNY
jgi:hypothetical protein